MTNADNLLPPILLFKGLLLPSQLMPIASFVASIPERNSTATHELIFLATQVPPLGSKSYFIEVSFEIGPSPIPIQPNSITDFIEISNNVILMNILFFIYG